MFRLRGRHWIILTAFIVAGVVGYLRLMIAPTLAAVLLLASTPSNAARRVADRSVVAFIPKTKAIKRVALSARMAQSA